MVTRIRRASGNTFDVRLSRTDGATQNSTANVSFMVVEAGVYAMEEHGVKMEAVVYNSAVTDGAVAGWVGENMSAKLENDYESPVVFGQVMSYRDSNWSTFWSRGREVTMSPSQEAIYVGKHVGEDANTNRSNELIGFIVIEHGAGVIGEVPYRVDLSDNSIREVIHNGTAQPVREGFTASVALANQAGMKGGDGGWAVLIDSRSDARNVQVAIDEDQSGDDERRHAQERVSTILFGAATASNASAFASDRLIGDVTGDGIFDSSDLVAVFAAGEYNDAADGNSVFEEGDWNGDGDFNSSDIVFAFSFGDYQLGARAAQLALDALPPGDHGGDPMQTSKLSGHAAPGSSRLDAADALFAGSDAWYVRHRAE